jgi:hypothetical protein
MAIMAIEEADRQLGRVPGIAASAGLGLTPQKRGFQG